MKWITIVIIVILAGGVLVFQNVREAYEPAKTVTILGEDSSNLAAYETLSDEFYDKSGIKVVFEKVSFEKLSEKADADFRNGGAKYDIVLNYNFSLAPYVENGYIVEVGSPTSPIPLRSTKINEVLFEGTLKETSFYYSDPRDPRSPPAQFGLPFAANTMVMVYNVDLFGDPLIRKDYKLKTGKELLPPSEWDEYLAIAEYFRSVDGGLYGVAMQGASGDWLYYEMANYLFGMGTGTSRKKHGWERTRLTLATPQNEDVLRYMKRLKNSSSGDFYTTDAPKQLQLMLDGKTAMALMWSDYLMPLTQRKSMFGNGPLFDFRPIPGSTSGLAGGAFYINKKSNHIDEATQFILFALGQEQQRSLIEKGLCSAVRDAYTPEVTAKVPYAKALYDSLDRGTFMFEAGKDASIISSALTTYVQMYMRDELTEFEALRQAEREIEQKSDNRP